MWNKNLPKLIGFIGLLGISFYVQAKEKSLPNTNKQSSENNTQHLQNNSYLSGLSLGTGLKNKIQEWNDSYPQLPLNPSEVVQGASDAIIYGKPRLSFRNLKNFFKAKQSLNLTNINNKKAIDRIFKQNYSYMFGFDYAFEGGIVDYFKNTDNPSNALDRKNILRSFQNVALNKVKSIPDIVNKKYHKKNIEENFSREKRKRKNFDGKLEKLSDSN